MLRSLKLFRVCSNKLTFHKCRKWFQRHNCNNTTTIYYHSNTIISREHHYHSNICTSAYRTIHFSKYNFAFTLCLDHNTTTLPQQYHRHHCTCLTSSSSRGILFGNAERHFSQRVHAEQPHHWAGLHHLTYDCRLYDACPPKKYFLASSVFKQHAWRRCSDPRPCHEKKASFQWAKLEPCHIDRKLVIACCP